MYIFEVTTAFKEMPDCWVTQDIPRDHMELCAWGIGEGGRWWGEQFMLICFHLLSISDQRSLNSVPLLVCVIQPFWAAPGETGIFISLVGLDLDLRAAEGWLALKRELNQPAKVRDEQKTVTTQTLVIDNAFAGTTPLGSKANG